MFSDAHSILQHLYTIPIETLGLSDEAVRLLKWHGLTSVGECIVFYVQNAPLEAHRSSELSLIIYGEVEAQMKAQGYWAHTLDAQIWDEIRSNWDEYVYSPRKLFVMWQGREVDLCQVPIETLGLSEDVLYGVQVFNLKTIGQWIEEYNYIYTEDDLYGEDHFIADDVYFMMLKEILVKMKEQDCWPFIAANFHPAFIE